MLNQIIPEDQFGFCKNTSVTDQLIDFQYDILSAVSQQNNVDIIYFDLQKAFDKVSHEKLIYKLEKLGISGNLLYWLNSFLRNRKFYVKINSTFSEEHKVSSGVGQGTVLGPLLFLLYISDVPRIVKVQQNIYCKIFADDLKVYTIYDSESGETSKLNLQDSINRFVTWCKDWQLQISATKSKSVYIGNNNVFTSYFVDGVHIPSTEQIRDLGFSFHRNLSYKEHIIHQVEKSLRQMHLIFRSFTINSAKTFVRLFSTMVLPLLEFSSSVWNPFLKRDIYNLESVQRKFTKIVFLDASATWKRCLLTMSD